MTANLPLETRLPIAAGEVCLKIDDRHFIDRAGPLLGCASRSNRSEGGELARYPEAHAFEGREGAIPVIAPLLWKARVYFCQSVQNLRPQNYRFAEIATARRNGFFYRTDLQGHGRIRNRPGTRRLTRPVTSKRVVVMTEAHMTYLVIFSGRNSSRVGAKMVGPERMSRSVTPLAEETLEPRSRHWSPVYLGVRRGEGGWARSLPSRSSALIVTDNQSKWRWGTLDPARVMCFWAWHRSKKPLELRFHRYREPE